MKRTPRAANLLRTASTTSTTGPQVRLLQNFGVAKVTTNGACAASAPATDERSSGRSGGRLVVICAAGASASVGVRERGAFAPTGTLLPRGVTSSVQNAWIRARSG